MENQFQTEITTLDCPECCKKGLQRTFINFETNSLGRIIKSSKTIGFNCCPVKGCGAEIDVLEWFPNWAENLLYERVGLRNKEIGKYTEGMEMPQYVLTVDSLEKQGIPFYKKIYSLPTNKKLDDSK